MASGAPAPEQRPVAGGSPSWEFAATGTRWRIHHSGWLDAQAAARLAGAVRADEARWSRFRDDSEVSALNRHAGEAVAISAQTFELLQVCRIWTARTGGIFQPLIGRALAGAGYRHSIEERAPYAARTPIPTPVRGAIELDRARLTARIPAGTQLDLGGVGKGAIAGRLARAAAPDGDQGLLIDAGGDLVAVGGDHVIAVEDPGNGGVRAWITLARGRAVATSGCGRRQWVNGDGRRSHHLIDPDTGAPGPRSHATLVAGDAVSADIGAKVLALRPEGLARCTLPACVHTPTGFQSNAAWDALAADRRAAVSA